MYDRDLSILGILADVVTFKAGLDRYFMKMKLFDLALLSFLYGRFSFNVYFFNNGCLHFKDFFLFII